MILMNKPLLLTAPTAAGKTALSLQLAQAFRQLGANTKPPNAELEIVTADAFTVYQGLDIGTAKPSLAEQNSVPHHLLDVISVKESFDVVQFVRLAENVIAEILARGNLPLVVGGTGFYLSALLRGLPLTPVSQLSQRHSLELELAERGLEALLQEIAQDSPTEAARMQRNPRRVVRALEVFRTHGRWPSQFGYSQPRFSYRAYGFSWPSELLQQRIEQRTHKMLLAGWPAEALWLERQISPKRQPRPTAWQALGYLTALSLAKDDISLPQAQQDIVLATRQYTKRQLTWMHKQPLKLLAANNALAEILSELA